MSRPTALRLLALALVAGVAADVLFRGNAGGLNVPLWILLIVVAGTLVAGRDGLDRLDPWDAWLAPAAVLLAGFIALRADPALVLVDLLLATTAAGAWLVALGGRPVTRGAAEAVAMSAAMLCGATVIGLIPVLRAARPLTRSLDGRVRIHPQLVPVLRGLAIAVPVLLVFAALFAAADVIFARAIDALTSIDIELADAPQRAVVILVVGWIVGGALILATGDWRAILGDGPGDAGRTSTRGPLWGPAVVAEAAPPAPPARSLGAAVARPTTGLRIGEVEASVLLIAVDLLFAVFVVLQLAYLFGGLDTLAASGQTYASYARRGFFELLTVAALAGALVAGLEVTVRRRSRPYRIATLVLLALTGLILASSFLRLRLYQDAYGWTELRFWVVVSIGWLAASLVALAVLVARDRSRWVLHALAILGLVTVAVANVLGPQAFSTDRNLARALDPSLIPFDGRVGLDADYLGSLGDDAVPAMVAAYASLGAVDRAALTVVLTERRRSLAQDESVRGWPAWNLARTRAQEALARWEP
jgi:hypothetical protein